MPDPIAVICLIKLDEVYAKSCPATMNAVSSRFSHFIASKMLPHAVEVNVGGAGTRGTQA